MMRGAQGKAGVENEREKKRERDRHTDTQVSMG